MVSWSVRLYWGSFFEDPGSYPNVFSVPAGSAVYWHAVVGEVLLGCFAKEELFFVFHVFGVDLFYASWHILLLLTKSMNGH